MITTLKSRKFCNVYIENKNIKIELMNQGRITDIIIVSKNKFDCFSTINELFKIKKILFVIWRIKSFDEETLDFILEIANQVKPNNYLQSDYLLELFNNFNICNFQGEHLIPIGEKNIFYIKFIKPLIDYIIGIFSLIVLSPLFILILIIISLIDRNGILYVRKRVGYKLRKIKFYKFKTMIDIPIEAERLERIEEIKKGYAVKTNKGEVTKVVNNKRVTKLGEILRRYSLDELPQIFMILENKLSIVGPRPLLDYEVNLLNVKQLKRFDAKPGITGLPQILGRGIISNIDGIILDKFYKENTNIFMDFKIILLTIPAIFNSNFKT